MKFFISILGFILFSTSILAQGELKIKTTNLVNNNGQVILLLFKKGQEFGVKKKPFKRFIATVISNKKAVFTIKNLVKGEYAFLVFHDEDSDGKFATNWIGMPKEGVGKSGTQGKRPNYKNSKFYFSGKEMTFTIALKYL